jgi:predicted ATPase/class 3 adenylate cyclase
MARAHADGLPEGTVTLLFTDIEGSTALLQTLGDRYGELLAEHHRLLREVWVSHRGVEIDTEGDAFFVAFAVPSDAVRAAAAAQAALAAHPWPAGTRCRVRMGLHTGEPRLRDGTYWGIDVHYAARLAAAAHGGQVLLSAATRALVIEAPVEDLGEHALKDFPAARHIYHLVLDGQGSAAYGPPRTLSSIRTNLPTIDSPLVGRDHDLHTVCGALSGGGARLVTLTGMGGSGKTRLAVSCGSELLDAFPDGVFLVELAPVGSADAVPAAVAEVVSAPQPTELAPEAATVHALRGRRLLLIIDNVEHVLDAAPLIGRLLQALPDLRVLATSQAPLRLAGERVIDLEPLAVPAEGDDDPQTLTQTAAVRLFLERARAADHRFAPDDADLRRVAELCRRLDGLPLALELAAARVRMGGVGALLRALERGPDALGRGARDLPERQRGLRAALDFTISLLGDDERELFAGLGVFAGAWSQEQADALFGFDLDAWEAMASLIDFSLVRTRGDGRLTMAERVRRHAREQLAASGREFDLRRRHAELVTQTLEDLSLVLLADLHGTIARTLEEVIEIEAAVTWTRAHDPELHRRLVATAGRPLYFAARLPLVRGDIERLLTDDRPEDVTAGRLLTGWAMVRCLVADMADAARISEQAVECHRRTGTRGELVNSIALHAHMLTLAGQGSQARAVVADGLALADDPSVDPRLRDQLEGTIAFAAVVEGNFDEAERRLQEILERPERTDFAARAAPSYLADCALGRGRYELALDRYAVALRLLRELDPNNTILQITAIAATLGGAGRDEQSAELVGAIERASREIGIGEQLLDHGPYGPFLQAVKARLGPAEWDRRRRHGHQLGLAQAADRALALAGAPVVG